jgi:spore coat protein U-like protein
MPRQRGMPAILSGMLAVAGATAASAQSPLSVAFAVSAGIVNGCAVATSGSSSWGTIQFPTVPGVTTGTINADLLSGGSTGLQIDCTPGMTVTLTADNGTQPSASNVRQLEISGDTSTPVPYLLYANGSNTPWTTQGVMLSFPVGTSHQAFPIHARATLPTATRAGAYSDTVRITMSW